MSSYFTLDQISKVAVLGSGTMGHGIAQVAAMAGCEVRMYDLDQSRLDAAMAKVAANLDKGVKRGKVEATLRDQSLRRLTTETSIEAACRGAHLVIEAVPESLALKAEVFGAVTQACAPETILATNTSSLSIAEIAERTDGPERVVGMHFFNPVHIMKLLEVVHHPGLDPQVLQTVCSLAQHWGKTAISVKDAPGFASSRLGLVIGLEAMRMFEQGVASARDIDTAMKLGYGHPMGPLELTDLVGLDVRLSIAEYLSKEVGPTFTPPEVLRQKVQAGHLGKKSGQGFYRWVDGKAQEL